MLLVLPARMVLEVSVAEHVAPSMLERDETVKKRPIRRGGMMPMDAVPVGAIYGKGQYTPEQQAVIDQKVFNNVDGERHDDGRYAQFREEASEFIPKVRAPEY